MHFGKRLRFIHILTLPKFLDKEDLWAQFYEMSFRSKYMGKKHIIQQNRAH